MSAFTTKGHVMRYSLRNWLLPLAALAGAVTVSGCVSAYQPAPAAYSYNYPYYPNYPATSYISPSYTAGWAYHDNYQAAYWPNSPNAIPNANGN
jgi:hypothetical protein